MKTTSLSIIGVLLIIVGAVAYGGMFTVSETQQALVLQFGKAQKSIQEPGLHFKWPFIQNVEYMEKRILDLDPRSQEVIASDKKRIVVDAYTRFQIADPLLYFRSVGNEQRARSRLESIVISSLRKVLGRVELQTVLSGERLSLTRQVSDDVNTEANKLGIKIVDVRIKRADLPEANSQAVYRRMQAEREREAREARARGAEESQKIKADADRQKTVLLAEAERQSEILRGEGDGERNRIFADAYMKDPEFFSFYRSLQAYRRALQSGDTTMVLSPDSEFFRYFGDFQGGAVR